MPEIIPVEPDLDNASEGSESVAATPFSGPEKYSPATPPRQIKGRFPMFKRTIFLLFLFCLINPMQGQAKTPAIVIMTHDSFAVSKGLFKPFEEQNRVTVQILKSGDAGAALNQAILSKKHPLGDLFFGVDNTFMGRALKADMFLAYTPKGIERVPEAMRLDSSHRLIPVDYGDVCLNIDKAWFAKHQVSPPTTLDDLIDPRFKGLTVIENPATSSPGLAFLLATIGCYGETGYLDYWQQFKKNDVYVSMGWSDAYYGQFTRAKGGTRPVVVSYASSPAAEVFYSEEKIDKSPTAAVLTPKTVFRQVEFAGILKGTQKPEIARRLMDFILSETFQKDIPLNMWVFPAVADTPLPPVFTRHARQADAPVMLSPQKIDAGRDRWIDAWTSTVLR